MTLRERPILFSAPMVRALLEGRKTQTRRIVKPQPQLIPGWAKAGVGGATDEERQDPDNAGLHLGIGRPREQTVRVGSLPHYMSEIARDLCPYGAPGNRLWVRETWMPVDVVGDDLVRVLYRASNDVRPDGISAIDFGAAKDCKATEAQIERTRDEMERPDRWFPAIHLPRSYSRITLEVTGVRVERLQAISEEDARAEGVTVGEPVPAMIVVTDVHGKTTRSRGQSVDFTARGAFCHLWDGINGKRANWASNPWVWVVEFRRIGP